MSTIWQTFRNLVIHSAEAALVESPSGLSLGVVQKLRTGADTVDIAVVSEHDIVEEAAQRVGYANIKGGDLRTIGAFTEQVLAVANGRKIRSLFVGAHGDPGRQNVGQYYALFANRPSVSLDAYAIADGRQLSELAPLAGNFTSDAVVTLGGCNVAAGNPGHYLLGMLARTWNVTVQASEDIQYPMQGLEGTHLVVCRPDPKLSVGYACTKQENEVVPPGDGAGALSFGSPLRVVSDLMQLGQALIAHL